MFASARSSRPASARTRGSDSGTSSVDVVRGAEAPERGRDDLVEPDRLPADLDGSRLEPAHVEQVADERVEAVDLLVDRGQELAPGFGRPVDVVLEQAA